MLTWACYETKLAKFPLLLCPQHDGRESGPGCLVGFAASRALPRGSALQLLSVAASIA
jgi:hypothetical protein